MFTRPQFFMSILMLLSLIVAACAPGISTGEYERVKSELMQAKADLDKTKGDLNQLKATSGGTTSGVAKDRVGYFEELLKNRRSIREYSNSSLTKDEAIKLVWAAQGITGDGGRRTAPSANVESPPLRIYAVVGNVDNISPGIYRYTSLNNALSQIKSGDTRNDLSNAMGRTNINYLKGSPIEASRASIKGAPVNLIITGIYSDTVDKYNPFLGAERGIRYVLLEAGHATQNVLLMATALNLGAIPMGGFSDDAVRSVLGIPQSENPLYIVPVGRKM